MPRFRSLAVGVRALLLAAAALAGCAGRATPTLIGSFPKVIATSAPPLDVFVTYASELDLEVSSVETAAHSASEIALKAGGYLTESTLWYAAGRPRATVTLAVPVGAYNDVRLRLLGLGTPTSEHLTGEVIVSYVDATHWNTYAHLTVHLTEKSRSLPHVSWPSVGWSPAQTLAQAFGVSAMLFTILLDIVIWVVVVLGPFVLLGLGLRWAVRQVRK
jgi:hypothetical protein